MSARREIETDRQTGGQTETETAHDSSHGCQFGVIMDGLRTAQLIIYEESSKSVNTLNNKWTIKRH